MSEEYYLISDSWSTSLSDWEQRFGVGPVIADPSGSWTQSTAEEYIDQKIEEQNTVILGQETKISLNTNLISQEMKSRQNRDAELTSLINEGIRTGEGVQFDTTPTSGSVNAVTSNGIHEALYNDPGIYNVTLHHPTSGVSGGSTYTLALAFSAIPSTIQRGGLTLKFVGNASSKFEYYRLKTAAWPASFSSSDWESLNIDETPTAGSKNLVESGGIKQLGQRYVISSNADFDTPVFANFNTTDGTLTFPGDSWIFVSKNNMKYNLPTTPVSYMINITSVVVLVFNCNTSTLSFQTSSYTFKDDDLLLAVVRKRYSTTNKTIIEVSGCFNYTIDNKALPPLQYKEVDQKISNLKNTFCGFGLTNTFNTLPNIDTVNKVLDLGTDSVLYIGSSYISFPQVFPNNPEYYREIPIYENGNATGAVKLILNTETKRIYSKGYNYSIQTNEIVIGGFRLEYQTHKFISCELPFEYTIDNNPFNKRQQNYLNGLGKNTHSYYGETLPINNCVIKTAFSLSDFGTATYSIVSQGMDVYNNKYLFQGSQASETRSIYVLDLEQKTILGNFLFEESGNWHMNNLNCANKENSSDKFPLIYLSECYGQRRCAVIKINDTADGYTIKQMITFDTSEHYGGGTYAQDWFIDLNNNLLYCYGNTSQRGSVEIVKFNLPDLTSATVTLTDSDILDSFIVEGIGIYQGSKLMNGRLVCPEGFGDSQWPAYISVIDLNKKQVVTKLPWGYGEPEAAALYNGGMLISNQSSTNPTYHLVTI